MPAVLRPQCPPTPRSSRSPSGGHGGECAAWGAASATAYLGTRQALVAAQVKAPQSQVAVERKDLRRVTEQVGARPKTSAEYEAPVARQQLLIARITSLNTMLSALSN